MDRRQIAESLNRIMSSSATIDNVAFNVLVMLGTLMEKNAKYADAWKEFGIFGVLQHNWTKIKRLKSQFWDEKNCEWRASAKELLNDIGQEGCVFDTTKDVAGYSLLALGLFKKDSANIEVAMNGLNKILELLDITGERNAFRSAGQDCV